MCGFFTHLLLFSSLGYLCLATDDEEYNSISQWPTVGITILVRNKAHSLPYFFSCLYNLDYPKKRLYLWIHSDYNADRSDEVIESWTQRYSSEYRAVYTTLNKTSGPRHYDEMKPTHWSPRRYRHVISLRKKALSFARDHWADHIFMLDADAFLTNPYTLKSLTLKENRSIVAPMLLSDGKYSNFWGGMREYYYQWTEDYDDIIGREKTGCFDVPMVHSAVLINLRHSATKSLTYDPQDLDYYKGPEDDIIVFAHSAMKTDVQMAVCNDLFYGYVQVPLNEKQSFEEDQDQLINIKLLALGRGEPLPLDTFMYMFTDKPLSWRFGLSDMFMINLERRPQRRNLMQQAFTEIGLLVRTIKAVDGRNINLMNLEAHGVTLMEEFQDPYHKRPMKAGEIGCFLSHYKIWKRMAEKGTPSALVLEDDLRFIPYFRKKFEQLLNELEPLDWDFVYIGRKMMEDAEEEFISPMLVKPRYSYWTIGYLISGRGAKKLVDAQPLKNMLPVDEFLPIMFDEHPNEEWKQKFPQRDLNAYASFPALVHPTHYTGDFGYISDTEDSAVSKPAQPRTDL